MSRRGWAVTVGAIAAVISGAHGARTDPHRAPSAPPVVALAPLAESAQAAPAGGSDAGVVVVEKDGGAKQFRFTETDVEGRLRTPEIVYFLRRVRAEFAAGDLGHRSFLRELSETRHDAHF